jgi:hypothetical protein
MTPTSERDRPSASKFRFRITSVRVFARRFHSKGLMDPNHPDAHLPGGNKQETAAVNAIIGRRGALRTLALTAARSAIGLASVRAEPATAAVETAVAPPGTTHYLGDAALLQHGRRDRRGLCGDR